MRALAIAACLAGCVHEPVTTYPDSVELARAPVAAHQSVVVHGERLYGGSTVEVNGQRLTLETLFARCPTAGDYEGDCPMAKSFGYGRDEVTIGEHSHVDPAVPAYIDGVLLVGGALAGVGYCTFECDSPWSYVSGGALITVGALVVIDVAVSHVLHHPWSVLGHVLR